ncbi:MAG TPA: hypothetical protein ACFYD3_04045 [Candidatus Hypogeohydataceae bacterium YC41]
MIQKEQELETVILQKLRAMEDLLKSFMSSLKELSQKKGLDEVYAPASGEIRWYVSSGDQVGSGELLRVAENPRIPGDTTDIRSPAIGTLIILVEEGEVGIGRLIAYIELGSTLV